MNCQVIGPISDEMLEMHYVELVEAWCIDCDRGLNKASKDYLSEDEFAAKYPFVFMIVGSGMQQPTIGIVEVHGANAYPFAWYDFADESWRYL